MSSINDEAKRSEHQLEFAIPAGNDMHNTTGGQFGHISAKLIWLTVWSFLGVFCFGVCGVCIGGVVVQGNFAVKFNELVNIKYVTGIISVYHGGGFFAVIASSYISDKWGRKASFLFNSIFYIVGNILNIASQNLGMFLAGRFLAGWGSYGFLYSSSIYVMEQAPAKSRGLLSTAANGLAMEVGYIIGGWLSVVYNDFAESNGSSWSWRIPFVVNLVPVCALLIAYPFVPESARWLVSQGRSEEALQVLKTLHGTSKDSDHTFAQAEHLHIVQQYAIDCTLPSTWMSMFTTYAKRTWTAILVQWGFLLGGAYFLATYGPQLFGAFGFSTRKSLIYQAATLTLLVVNWVSGPLIDRVGRKPFLVFGLVGELMMLCILCALSKYYGDGKDQMGAKAFVGIYLFNEVVVAITEPAAYLMAAELFPLHVRTKGVSISFGFLALTNTWILESAGTMVHSLGWKAYLLFICITATNVVLFVWLLPETKGVPLEDMAKLFGDKDQAVSDSSVEKL